MSQETKKFNQFSEDWCVWSVRYSPFLRDLSPEGKASFRMYCGKVTGFSPYRDPYGFAEPLLEVASNGGTAMSYEFDLATEDIPALLQSGALHIHSSQQVASLSVQDPQKLPAVPCIKHDKDMLGQGIETPYPTIQDAMGYKQVNPDSPYPLPRWSDVDSLLAYQLHWTHVEMFGSRQDVAGRAWLHRGGWAEPGEQYISNSYYGSDYATQRLQVTYPLVYQEVPPIDPELPPDPEVSKGVVNWEGGGSTYIAMKPIDPGPVPEE
jgi:hypothetical protein